MFEQLALPLMCAPMSFASSTALARACRDAGVVAGWQGGRVTSTEELRGYLECLASEGRAPAIVNVPASIAAAPDGPDKLRLLAAHRVPLVLSSVGNPAALAERVHDWGGRIVQDVTTMRHAEKAIAAGVDGLMATCAGAGGHTGFLTPFAFVPALRRVWDGLLIVACGIADARGVSAALALGGDLACMGTRFIATPESGVREEHRAIIAGAGVDDIVVSAAMNGVPANWLTPSVREAGLDPANLPTARVPMPSGAKPWRDVFSAGQSVCLIDRGEAVAALVARLATEFAALVPDDRAWRGRLAALEAAWATTPEGNSTP